MNDYLRSHNEISVWENNPSSIICLLFREQKFQVPEPPLSAPQIPFSSSKDVWGVKQSAEDCPHEITEYLTRMEHSQEKYVDSSFLLHTL